jgi:hypothetical protein
MDRPVACPHPFPFAFHRTVEETDRLAEDVVHDTAVRNGSAALLRAIERSR